MYKYITFHKYKIDFLNFKTNKICEYLYWFTLCIKYIYCYFNLLLLAFKYKQ